MWQSMNFLLTATVFPKSLHDLAAVLYTAFAPSFEEAQTVRKLGEQCVKFVLVVLLSTRLSDIYMHVCHIGEHSKQRIAHNPIHPPTNKHARTLWYSSRAVW